NSILANFDFGQLWSLALAASMSQKYKVSLADYKTLASPKPLPMASTQATYHQAPSSPRDSIDSSNDPSDSVHLTAAPPHAFTVNIPLIYLSRVPLLGLLGPPNQPGGYESLSFYPTAITRITCIVLICVSMGLYVPGGVTRCRLAIAALSLALPRNLFAIIFRPQRARPAWSVWGLVNAAVDAIVFTLLLVGIHLAFHNHYSRGNGNNPENVAGSVVGWVAA
ncbi:hypothetical protein V502_10183, partial [Pseudogymnoascus sp. VKM F-4520 (FW-2644)]